MDDLASPGGEAARRATRISASSYLSVAKADRDSADHRHGRNLTTSNATAAATAHVGERTAERARALLAARGFSVTIEGGRYLTNAERNAAKAAHGRTQLRAASVRALTLPRGPQSVESGDLPASRRDSRQNQVLKNSPRRASARSTAAPRPRQGLKTRPSTRGRPPRPLEIQRLGAELVKRIPWLSRNCHVGRVIGVLERAGIAGDAWSAQGVLDTIERFCRTRGIQIADPVGQRDPLAYFSWTLRAALVDDLEPDRVRRERQTAERARERAAHAEAARIEAERVAAIDWEAVEIVQRQMREQFPRPIKAARRELAQSSELLTTKSLTRPGGAVE